jgi:hypothetical protein
MKLGAVVRNLPVQGAQIILDQTKIKAAQEILAKVTKIVGVVPLDMAKLHLGDIFYEPIPNANAAIPIVHTEMGLTGAAASLRAVLAACNSAGLESASIKIDNLGNMSINAILPGTGMIVISGDTATCIGGNIESTMVAGHSAVVGDVLNSWLASHTHDSSVGPTGPPTAVSQATLPLHLSLKVFIA